MNTEKLDPETVIPEGIEVPREGWVFEDATHMQHMHAYYYIHPDAPGLRWEKGHATLIGHPDACGIGPDRWNQVRRA